MTTISQLPANVLSPHSHTDGVSVIVSQLVSGKDFTVGDLFVENSRNEMNTRTFYYYYKITKINKKTLWCVPARPDGSVIPDREPIQKPIVARTKVLSVSTTNLLLENKKD